MGALAALIIEVAPYLAAFAVVIATSAFATGIAAQLEAALVRVRDSTTWAKLTAWFSLHSLLTALLAHPVSQDIIENQGLAPSVVLNTEAVGSTAVAASLVPIITFPLFETVEQADIYHTQWVEVYRQGAISYEQYATIYAYYSQERARLDAVPEAVSIPPALAPSIPTPVSPQAVAPSIPAPSAAAAPAATTGISPTVVLQPNINVAIPPLVIPAPVVNNIPIPAPQVGINNIVDTAGMASTISAALPLVGVAFANALPQIGKELGHLLQQGRNTCFKTTSGALMSVLAPTVLGGLSIAALTDEGKLGGFINEQATRWFDSALNPDRFPHPATPENVFAVASARLKEAMSFGLQAHVFSIIAESNFVLKQLGMPQIAGFLADMAGFKRIADSTMGEVEKAALQMPMQRLARRTFRSQIPNIVDLQMMYAKKEIPGEGTGAAPNLAGALAEWGFPQEWIEVYKEYLWNDPRLGEVIRIGQFFSPELVPELARPDSATAEWMRRAKIADKYIESSDWYYAWRAAKAGYDPRDVPVLVETAKRATSRREQTLYLDAVTRMVREGYRDREWAKTEIEKAWVLANPVSARLDAVELQTDFKLLEDTKAIVIMAMSRGLVTRDEAREQMVKLGLTAQRADIEVLKGTLGMVPGLRIQVARPEELLEETGVEAI